MIKTTAIPWPDEANILQKWSFVYNRLLLGFFGCGFLSVIFFSVFVLLPLSFASRFFQPPDLYSFEFWWLVRDVIFGGVIAGVLAVIIGWIGTLATALVNWLLNWLNRPDAFCSLSFSLAMIPLACMYGMIVEMISFDQWGTEVLFLGFFVGFTATTLFSAVYGIRYSRKFTIQNQSELLSSRHGLSLRSIFGLTSLAAILFAIDRGSLVVIIPFGICAFVNLFGVLAYRKWVTVHRDSASRRKFGE